MIAAILWGAIYLAGAFGIWRMGPLYEFTQGGWREVSRFGRFFACLIWPVTLLQMWDP